MARRLAGPWRQRRGLHQPAMAAGARRTDYVGTRLSGEGVCGVAARAALLVLKGA